MKLIQTRQILAYSLLGICFLILSALEGVGPVYEITWYTIDAGGGISSAANYEVAGTIGQPDPATLTGAGYEVSGGFWPFFSELPCSADTSGDRQVNVTDLLSLLGAWGACPIPCPQDSNQDGQVNVTDLLFLLGSWGACP